MSLNDKQWGKVANYVRSSVVSQFDPGSMFTQDVDVSALSHPHQGFYISVESSSGEHLAREGFLKENLKSIKESLDIVSRNVYSALSAKGVGLSDVQTSTFYFTLVLNHYYISDPLSWDENADGVYFMWGQDYRALYLPYQIKKMNVSKVEILDRLCCHEAGVVSNLWRLPEGLVWRLVCQTHVA